MNNIDSAAQIRGAQSPSPVSDNNKKLSIKSRKRSRALFYAAYMALPVLQFCVFYIYVNFNSFVLAFQKYSIPEDGSMGFLISFAGFSNFASAWKTFLTSGGMIINSLRLFACNILIVIPLALLFSFYLYKGYKFSGIFKTVLFMPKVISDLVLSVIFKYIANDGYMGVVQMLTGTMPQYGLMDNPATEVATILFYNVWVGFGVNVLLYQGAMSAINESLVEAAKLDGANAVQEFFKLTIPMIFSTISTFIVLAIAAVFTNQMNLLALKGVSAGELSTIGYYLYIQAQESDVITSKLGVLDYPTLSAFGLIISLIVGPITLIARALMNKYGPSVD